MSNARKKASNLPGPLQDLYLFAVQSQQFLQKCDRPSQKGKEIWFLNTYVNRVPKDCSIMCFGICRDGCSGICDKIGVHSNQQHHFNMRNVWCSIAKEILRYPVFIIIPF